jgi:beta-N-acetylhexosaminidase
MTELTKVVAQMVMPRIDGVFLEDVSYRREIEDLVRMGLGGFILFRGDIESTPSRLRELQELADIPLLITSDVERGLGQQLTGGTRFPSQRAIASAIKTRSRQDAALLNRMLDAVRTETRAAGIHGVFSPVVDVNSNPCNPIICTRAFGSEPGIVEWFGRRYITRLQKPDSSGHLELLACAKHFPGHGDTDQDSHSVLPVISAARPRLNSLDLPPFREAVKDGVGMVMVAHLLVPALDPEKPTTFSKKTITALLREGMGFNGLIVSDALDMLALAGQYSQEEIAVRSVESGIDVLLHPKDARVTTEAVVKAVEQGRITLQRIQESAGRIRDAKIRLGLFQKAAAGKPKINYGQHRMIARELSNKALRIVSGNEKMLPFPSGAGACFLLDDDDAGRGETFLNSIQAAKTVLTPSSDLVQEHVQERVNAADWVVIPIVSKISASKGRSGISAKLEEIGERILAASKKANKRTVVISFDSPYILDRFKDADVCIAGYDWMNEIQEAAAGMVAGK